MTTINPYLKIFKLWNIYIFKIIFVFLIKVAISEKFQVQFSVFSL